MALLQFHGIYFSNLQNAQDAPLTREVETQYDSVANSLVAYLETSGNTTFSKLTQSIFPCREAYNAFEVALDVTCGDKGGINRLTGMVYVLALTILFIAFFYFCLFTFAFIQALQMSRLAEFNSMLPPTRTTLYDTTYNGYNTGNYTTQTFGDYELN